MVTNDIRCKVCSLYAVVLILGWFEWQEIERMSQRLCIIGGRRCRPSPRGNRMEIYWKILHLNSVIYVCHQKNCVVQAYNIHRDKFEIVEDIQMPLLTVPNDFSDF